MKKLILTSFLLAAALNVGAINKMKVNVSKPGAPVQSTMYGIFFEDINYAADGGLYAELIMNRSFEYPNAFIPFGVLMIDGVIKLVDFPLYKNTLF